jgi:hypothetical protein
LYESTYVTFFEFHNYTLFLAFIQTFRSGLQTHSGDSVCLTKKWQYAILKSALKNLILNKRWGTKVSIQGIKATLLPNDEATLLDYGIDYDEWLIAARHGQVPCFGKLHWSVWSIDDIFDYDIVDGKCVSIDHIPPTQRRVFGATQQGADDLVGRIDSVKYLC